MAKKPVQCDSVLILPTSGVVQRRHTVLRRASFSVRQLLSSQDLEHAPWFVQSNRLRRLPINAHTQDPLLARRSAVA
jgi:hypothetical protein